MKRINKVLMIAFITMSSIVFINNLKVDAKMKTLKYSIMNISQTLQTADGNKENVTIGCRCKNCTEHVGLNEKMKRVVIKAYNKQGEIGVCKEQSDLYNIQVKHYCANGALVDENGRKFNYTSIYDEGFTSMQGACLKGNLLYVAFSDKGRTTSAGNDLTAIVQLKIDKTAGKYSVAFVGIIDGITVRNIYGLGHANDLYYKTNSNYLHSAWYKKGDKKDYDFRMGFMSDISKVSYTGKNIEQTSRKIKKIFGVAKGKGNKLTLGCVAKKSKMIICNYEFKNSAYENYKELFVKNKKYGIYDKPQCMEYAKIKKKSKNLLYVVRFRNNYKKSSHKKNNKNLLNNCLVVYSKKGKVINSYKINEPSGYKQYLWEVESINHLSGKEFCMTIAKPSPLKRALLCCAKIS